jgi:hypothetical protein
MHELQRALEQRSRQLLTTSVQELAVDMHSMLAQLRLARRAYTARVSIACTTRVSIAFMARRAGCCEGQG